MCLVSFLYFMYNTINLIYCLFHQQPFTLQKLNDLFNSQYVFFILYNIILYNEFNIMLRYELLVPILN